MSLGSRWSIVDAHLQPCGFHWLDQRDLLQLWGKSPAEPNRKNLLSRSRHELGKIPAGSFNNGNPSCDGDRNEVVNLARFCPRRPHQTLDRDLEYRRRFMSRAWSVAMPPSFTSTGRTPRRTSSTSSPTKSIGCRRPESSWRTATGSSPGSWNSRPTVWANCTPWSRTEAEATPVWPWCTCPSGWPSAAVCPSPTSCWTTTVPGTCSKGWASAFPAAPTLPSPAPNLRIDQWRC